MEHPELRDALEKLRLNDASFFTSQTRCAWFRIPLRVPGTPAWRSSGTARREFDMDLVTTAPGVLTA
jgi:translation elongation factor EF-4